MNKKIMLIPLLISLLLIPIVFAYTFYVQTDKFYYTSNETVFINGQLTKKPPQTINLWIVYQQPCGFPLPPCFINFFATLTTDSNGNFNTSWTIPSGTQTGNYQVTAQFKDGNKLVSTATFLNIS